MNSNKFRIHSAANPCCKCVLYISLWVYQYINWGLFWKMTYLCLCCFRFRFDFVAHMRISAVQAWTTNSSCLKYCCCNLCQFILCAVQAWSTWARCCSGKWSRSWICWTARREAKYWLRYWDIIEIGRRVMRDRFETSITFFFLIWMTNR